ncbi:MAG TPA: PAS domain-containing protein [Candidatus Hydrogenedentes bacterium]|nr:PAS domain-containing protein [Candidatus Hydrogenedentota bacterium]HPG68226.1 PAS domain-containing protein [Candidatus Hydrogenedentota bacterium]
MADECIRVLLVDDDNGRRGAQRSALADDAFAIIEATTAEEGLALCHSEAPDCVVIADKLGDMDATTFLDSLSDASGFVAIPVIVLQTKQNRRTLDGVLNSGAWDCIPVADWDTLGARVVRYAADHGAVARLLAEQRVLVRTLLTGSPGFLVLKNKALQYEAVNPAFCQFVGKSPEEIIGATDADLFAKQDAEPLRSGDRKVMASGVPHTELERLGDESQPRWLEITRSPITDASGESTGLLWSARDITGFKLMEDAVREDHDHYATLAQDQTELACRFDKDLALTFIGEPLCRFLDKPREELERQSFLAILPEEEHANVQETLKKLNPKTPTAVCEMGAVSPAGDICWQQWFIRALFDGKAHLLGYQAVGRDLTAGKRAQDSLAELQEKAAAFETELAGLQERLAQAQSGTADAEKRAQDKDAEIQRLAAECEQIGTQHQETVKEQQARIEQLSAESERLKAENAKLLDRGAAELERAQEQLKAAIDARARVLGAVGQMTGATANASALTQELTGLMVMAVQKLAGTEGPSPELDKLDKVFKDIGALVQQIRQRMGH